MRGDNLNTKTQQSKYRQVRSQQNEPQAWNDVLLGIVLLHYKEQISHCLCLKILCAKKTFGNSDLDLALQNNINPQQLQSVSRLTFSCHMEAGQEEETEVWNVSLRLGS